MANRTGALERPAAAKEYSSSLWGDAFRRLIRNRLAIVGGVIVLGLLFLLFFGPLVAPYPYQEQHLKELVANNNKPIGPFTGGFLFGTDDLGRDLLSRMMDGAQISMTVALVVQAVVLLIGLPIGAAAAWYGGKTDAILMRFTDVIYAFPDLLFIILLTVSSA